MEHLDDLRHSLRRYRKIHIILDNAKFHYQSQPLYEFLGEHSGRFVFHFLPRYGTCSTPTWSRGWWRGSPPRSSASTRRG
jgi:hypothetical protein